MSGNVKFRWFLLAFFLIAIFCSGCASPKAHYNLGNAYAKSGQYQKAIASFKEAIRTKPDYAEAHHNLGITCAILGRYEEAIASFKEAIRIKPDYADAHNNL